MLNGTGEMEIANAKNWEFKQVDGSWIPKVIIGDVREACEYLPENFVDCIITSPPYRMQRDYKHPSQIGREKSPEDYVEAIVEVFKKLRPKLKKPLLYF